MGKNKIVKSGNRMVTLVLPIPSAIGNIDTRKPGAWKLCYNLRSEEFKKLSLAEKHRGVVLRVVIRTELNEFHYFIQFSSEDDAKGFMKEFETD